MAVALDWNLGTDAPDRSLERREGERALDGERSGSSSRASLLPRKGEEKLESDDREDSLRDTRPAGGGGLAYRGRDSSGF
jgi:hypothetical protein